MCSFRFVPSWVRNVPGADFETQSAIYEIAVATISKSAPQWAAFSRWMSAGAAAVVGASLSNLVALGVTDNPVSKLGLSLAILSFIPALALEWKYLVLQPIADGNAAGKAIFESRKDLHVPTVIEEVLQRTPRKVAKNFREIFRSGKILDAARFLWGIAAQGRRLLKWQMLLLVVSVVLIATPKIVPWFDFLASVPGR